jgi:antitoxin ParD1/3/4
MTDMTISLLDPQRAYIEELVAKGEYKDPSEYLQALVDRDWLARERDRIDALLIEGLDSGPAELMDFEAMRQRLRDRLAVREGS